MQNKDIVKFNKEGVYIDISKQGYGKTYKANKDFKKGEVVMIGFGRVIDHQTPHTSVQIGAKKHYLPSKWTGMYWNHSCDPNTCVQTRSDGFPNLVAVKNIKKDDEITFAYWETEYSWIKNADEVKIDCKCGSRNCKGRIVSFSQLSGKERSSVVKNNLCSDYLKACV